MPHSEENAEDLRPQLGQQRDDRTQIDQGARSMRRRAEVKPDDFLSLPVYSRWSRLLWGAAALLLGWCWSAAPAAAQLNRSGHHSPYQFELEPHLVWQWNADEAAIDDGIGLGFRASIPVLREGPLPSIDNNLAVSFGFAWAHFPECRVERGECSENDFWVPVVAQWNFFLTPSFSLFPEFGLGFRNAVFDGGALCDGRGCRHSSLEVHPVMWFGARVHLSEMFALVMRLGTPWLQFGVSFWI